MGILQKHEFRRVMPFIAVVFLQFGYAGMDVLSKAAMNKGMSSYVFVVYRHAIAFVVITPFAVILDKKARPKMTISIFTKIVALSILEPVIDQNFYFLGMKYTTASFASAMSNMLPAITFLMAWILRLEKIKLRSIHSHVKVAGTVVTVAGAMLMTFLKGPVLEIFEAHGTNTLNQQSGGSNLQHVIKGSVMITLSSFCWSGFMILQAITLEAYPAELSLTAWICFLGTVEGAAVALVMERRHPSVWSLHWDRKLLAAVYSGIVCSGLTYYIQGVVMKARGPVFITAFTPLCMVIVAVMGSFILFEQLYLGRVIGAFVIVLGLYLVVWGKSKDNEQSTPMTEEILSPTKLIADGSSIRKDSANNEVIIITNSGQGIVAPDEQV
ncbi:hypothetical protein QN277_012897 [Acacia crassicarpa]|uniref:WAT1-related protein n=1 Tax=Acacia crassicarpa TaxID=499986 RepID=A0AAE1N1L8_9FABA|nr:hypothetical protein QN277_012897 [Acacia crassicarpa]